MLSFSSIIKIYQTERNKRTKRNPSFSKRQNLEFQCFEKAKLRIPMFGKRQNLEFHCLEKAEFRILMFLK